VDAEQVAALRVHYADIGLDEADLAIDPMTQFSAWLAEVVELGVPEPNAMVLSTANANGQPSSRHVLLKGAGPDGFVFFTNYGSRKGRDLAANPLASLCFPWFCIGRQVVVTGLVSKVTRQESDAYFASRPRSSQLGAWASAHQSDVVASRATLDDAYAQVSAKFADIDAIPTPPFWGGFRLSPSTVEFWQGRNARLHDRLRFVRTDVMDGGASAPWVVERLSP
jgi:pyridoxamine 5'-phosphate oxidase